MENCVFCKIIKGEIPNYTVYENEHTLAFLDIKPHAKGHTVVIPKTHETTVFDLNEETLHHVMDSVKKTMQIIQEKLNPEGFNVGWNHNSYAGQVVPHLHVHIFPRFQGDNGESMHSIVNSPGDMSVEDLAAIFK